MTEIERLQETLPEGFTVATYSIDGETRYTFSRGLYSTVFYAVSDIEKAKAFATGLAIGFYAGQAED